MRLSGNPQADISVAVTQNENINLYVRSYHEINTDRLIHHLSDNPAFHITSCLDDSADLAHFKISQPDILLIHQAIIEPLLKNGTPIDMLFDDYRQCVPDVRIILFDSHIEEAVVRRLIRSGVHGVIDNRMTPQDLALAIREVSLGGYWIDRQLMDELIHHAIELEQVMEREVKSKIDELQYKLTRREADVFHLVMEGMPTKQIANTMHLSEQGVKLHLGRLFKKFQVTNRTQLILLAFTQMCPVNNLVHLIRKSVDKRRLEKGYAPLISDPLEERVN